jgi:hyperosmotically inducible protein
MKNLLLKLTLLSGAALVAAVPALADNTAKPLDQRVRHELVMLPYYNIFDDISFRIDPATNTVYLQGDVTNPVLKSDAGRVVRHVEGVTNVVNNINVLPLSPFDRRIRFAEARAIYGFATLNRYALGTLPPIHIIVDNGHVKLLGVVDSQADKNVAGIRANGVPGVFSVENDLIVAHS